MMDTSVLVHVDLRGVPIRVGRLWIRVRGGRESASFEYDAAWTDHPLRFALEPALTVGPGPYHTRGRLFGSFGDSAPGPLGPGAPPPCRSPGGRDRKGEHPGLCSNPISSSRGRRNPHRRAPVLDAAGRALSRRSGRGARSPAGRSSPAHGGLEEGTPPTRKGRRSSPAGRSRILPRWRTGPRLRSGTPAASWRLPNFRARRTTGTIVLWEGVALALAKRAGIRVPAWRLETVARKGESWFFSGSTAREAIGCRFSRR